MAGCVGGLLLPHPGTRNEQSITHLVEYPIHVWLVREGDLRRAYALAAVRGHEAVVAVAHTVAGERTQAVAHAVV